jgi:hypothetical protein
MRRNGPPQPSPESNQNKVERSPERILSSEEILSAISEHVEGFTLGRELSDEKGVYLLEVEVKGEREGEVIEYQYKRKGIYQKGTYNSSPETTISVIYYEDGRPVHGEKLAVFDEETGVWKRL